MAWLMIILNFILLSFNYAQLSNELIGINVLESLRASNLTCDLHAFVHSNNESDLEYASLVNDLSTYCSGSKTPEEYGTLCHMILIELKIGCSLLKQNRSWAVKYTTLYTSTQICSMNKITTINRWILKKLSSDGVKDIGATSMQLCYTVTSSNETLRLATFFYKLAPNIKRAEKYDRISSLNVTLTNSITNKLILDNQTNQETEKNQSKNETRQEDQLWDKKMNEDLSLQNLKSANETRTVDLQKSSNHTEEQTSTEMKKIEMVNPIGRLQEEPAREQVNERPKPKPLDIETAFKSNDNNNRNWIEGQNDDEKKQNEEPFEPNSFRQRKLPENSLINPSATKKKLTLNGLDTTINPSILQDSYDRMMSEDNDLVPPNYLFNNRRIEYANRISIGPRSSMYHDQAQTWSNNIVTSFLVLILCIIIVYLILNNKNKILGLIIEGCRRRQEKHGYRYGGSSHVTRLSRLSQSI